VGWTPGVEVVSGVFAATVGAPACVSEVGAFSGGLRGGVADAAAAGRPAAAGPAGVACAG
jgi:hypothetical protein